MEEREQRRRRRAAGQEWFDGLAVDYLDLPDVDRTRMFGSEGLRARGKFFAFVGSEGDLIVKLPAELAAGLVADGAAEPVKIGRNPAREWLSLPEVADGDLQPWRDALAEAHRYATST